ncbi:hypothetical protein [Paucibacter sp. M5-1]|uniref:hypothetical protein n=1 Tax=Paucibacter sp. M5-1 TaxID=3015998 RepID=UPI0022B89BA7|nr:hypothetical protein [Paucibacter sp. M5-1]MCZ7880626.1 hypothetical protein [Paucibacter sp. M5-1]
MEVMVGSTALMRELTERILKVSGLEFELGEVPYSRAIADFSAGRAQVLLMGEASLKGVDPNGVRVPMMNMQVALYTRMPAYRYPLDGNSVIGTLRGFQIPGQLTSFGAQQQSANKIESLLKMLALGRITHAILVKANADIYMKNNPEIRKAIEVSAIVGALQVNAHISSRLGQACTERLMYAASKVRLSEMERIFAKTVPELDYKEFKY